MEDRPNPPATPAASQPQFDYQPSPEESELIRLSQEWMASALLHRDETKLRELMAPEFTLQIWDASRAPQPLAAWLDMLRGRLEGIEFEYAGLNARVFGDVAVVYSRFRWKGTIDGTPFADSGFMADVWTRTAGRWQVVARRSAPREQIQKLLEAGNR